MRRSAMFATIGCAVFLACGFAPQTTRKSRPESASPPTAPAASASASGAHVPEAERAAEPGYQAAVKLANASDLKDAEARNAVLDAIEAALKAGACPTRTLVEDAFIPLHTAQRYRELIRDHARQSSISMRLTGIDGKPLHVRGVIRDEAGKPVADALVYVYHTDARGLYSENGMDESNPRLFGYMKTDAEGRYAYTTIRPGHYPDENEPVEQHVHYEISAVGFKPLITRVGFADDPFWKGKRVPTWAIAVATNDIGLDTCEYDLTLKRAMATNESP